MKLSYLKSWALTELHHVIRIEPHRYSAKEPWLDELFRGRDYLATSKLTIAALPDLRLPTSATELYELENTVMIHSVLGELNRSQAADDRLWAYLAHGPMWHYMRKRWPIEGNADKSAYINEHYFVRDARGLVRQGIARLWWFGRATCMPTAADPYVLTALLLKTTDARQQVMERQFWRNERILHPFLRRIAYWNGQNVDLYSPRERFRELCKNVNLVGGSRLLDSLAAREIANIVDAHAEKYREGQGAAAS